LLEAPVLFISGLRNIPMTQADQSALREYVYNGGTILACACSDSDVFDRSFRELMASAFPDSPMVPIEKDHEIYTCLFDIPPDARPTIYGVSEGCTMNILYIPKGKYSCKWTTGDKSGYSFEMGANLLSFLVGDRQLKNRIEPVSYTPLRNLTESEKRRPERGALTIGQIKHSGQWKPHRLDVPNLMAKLKSQAGVTVAVDPEPVDLSSTDLYSYPILYMTGHFGTTFTEIEAANLARFLQKGGTLIAEACCGRTEFDDSFRRLAGKLFEGKNLVRLPLENELFKKPFDIRTVDFRTSAQKRYPGVTSPPLEGLEIDGRVALIYSPVSFGCGLDGHPCHSCVGYTPESSFNIAVNLIIYSLNH
jgi:hypothetical protein